jgi:cell division protein FtsB
LAQEEQELVKENEELRAQMAGLNQQINDVLTELTGPAPADKPQFKNALESARMQK